MVASQCRNNGNISIGAIMDTEAIVWCSDNGNSVSVGPIATVAEAM